MAAMASILQHPLNAKDEVVVRKTAHFTPSYWGDFFINFISKSDPCTDKRENELKEEVKKMFFTHSDEPLQELMSLIDAIQRLGLGYHFEEQIDVALKRIYDASVDYDNLYFFSLLFRLLRQAGYNISSDCFNKFKNEDGKFKESLSGDARGLLSMYEAAYLGIHGESILDEAIAFARGHLKSMVGQVSAPLARDIELALDMPTRRSLVRIRTKQYISVYEMDDQRNDVLLELAKLDYNRVQRLHQRELREVSAWWKETGLAQKLSFARDRVVECYVWALGTYHEPKYSRGRIISAKVSTLTALLDDTYDSYGTFEELQPFNDMIQRWDLGTLHEVPEYMQVFIVALFDTFKEFEEELKREGNAYRVDYLRESMKTLCKAYYQELLWIRHRYIPNFQEHLQVSAISCTYPILHCLSFVGMDHIATKEAFDWVIKVPQILWSSSVICRFMDDINTNKREQENDYMPTSIQCYAIEHSLSEEEVRLKIREVLVEDEWKKMNEELLLRPDQGIPLALYMPAFNLTCMMVEGYKHSDGFNNPEVDLKDKVYLMLVDPVVIQG
ncbi:(-)-germacrene D synthase [Acorus calamus]|uniref:(-)-germacrene D synthase n=1 Tax=Acorus calamus TaxID=4465 RepID=A0AAV9CKD4_ACOCL|nr:(-)-germacrene D synthase [Acorus calamus]